MDVDPDESPQHKLFDLPAPVVPAGIANPEAYIRGWNAALREISRVIEEALASIRPPPVARVGDEHAPMAPPPKSKGMHKRGIPKRIIDALANRPLSKDELYSAIRMRGETAAPEAIQTAIRRLIAASKITFQDDLYSLAEPERDEPGGTEMPSVAGDLATGSAAKEARQHQS